MTPGGPLLQRGPAGFLGSGRRLHGISEQGWSSQQGDRRAANRGEVTSSVRKMTVWNPDAGATLGGVMFAKLKEAGRSGRRVPGSVNAHGGLETPGAHVCRWLLLTT